MNTATFSQPDFPITFSVTAKFNTGYRLKTLFLPLLLTLFGLLSCSAERQRAPFQLLLPGGQSVGITVRGAGISDWKDIRITQAPEGGGFSTPVFELEKPVRFTGDDQAFSIEYSVQNAGRELSLVLLGEKGNPLKQVKLPVQGNSRLRYGVFPGKDTVLTGFLLKSNGESATGLSAADISVTAPGFILTRDSLEVVEGITPRNPSLVSPDHFSLSVSYPETPDGDIAGGIILSIDTGRAGRGGKAAAEADVTLARSGGELRKTYRLSLNPAKNSYSFPRGLTGYLPESMEFSTASGIDEISVRLLPPLDPGERSFYDPDMQPVPADQATILGYDRRSWRTGAFELFSWNAFPDVLVFDFADYAIQSKFFGRLGFFVAVTGEAGRIEEEAYYEGRHAYNAHDYRPEDLAAFFELARTGGRRLNPEESFLKELCLKKGILRAEGGMVRPGSGAVLSVSRETSPSWLRKRLLTHESAHGIFYAAKAYRDRCLSLWDSLETHEKEFFLVFLGNKGRLDGREGYDGYDTNNRYLMANEMQAHVVQLEPGQADSYFRGYLARMKRMFPEKEQSLLRAEVDVEIFTRIRTALETAMFETTGIRGADFYTVTPQER